MTDSTMTKTAFFAVKPETVWAFLTEADKLGEWFHPAEADLAADSDYALLEGGNKIIWGTVLTWDPTSTLQYTFEIAPFGGMSTTVTWSLMESHGGTMLTLTHAGVGELGDAALGMLMALDDGWDKHIASLRAKMNKGVEPASDCAEH